MIQPLAETRFVTSDGDRLRRVVRQVQTGADGGSRDHPFVLGGEHSLDSWPGCVEECFGGFRRMVEIERHQAGRRACAPGQRWSVAMVTGSPRRSAARRKAPAR